MRRIVTGVMLLLVTILPAVPAAAADFAVTMNVSYLAGAPYLDLVSVDGVGEQVPVTVTATGGGVSWEGTNNVPQPNRLLRVSDVARVPTRGGLTIAVTAGTQSATLSWPHGLDLVLTDTVRARATALPNRDLSITGYGDGPDGAIRQERLVTANDQGHAGGGFGQLAIPGGGAWRAGTRVIAEQIATLDGTAVETTVMRDLPTLAVLAGSPPRVDLGGQHTGGFEPASQVQAFGRTTVTGTYRTDRPADPAGAVIEVGGVPLRTSTTASPVAVTGWDPGSLTARGTAPAGAELAVEIHDVTTNTNGSTVTADASGNWSATALNVNDPTSDVEVRAVLEVPDDHGVLLGAERRFGSFRDPTATGFAAVGAGESATEDRQATAREAAAANSVAALDLIIGEPDTFRVQDQPGDGLEHTYTVAKDGTIHVAHDTALGLFGAVVSTVTGDDFSPPLDLTTGFEVEVDRGGTKTTLQVPRFQATLDTSNTTISGVTTPSDTVGVTVNLPVIGQVGATLQTDASGAFEFTAGTSTQGGWVSVLHDSADSTVGVRFGTGVGDDLPWSRRVGPAGTTFTPTPQGGVRIPGVARGSRVEMVLGDDFPPDGAAGTTVAARLRASDGRNRPVDVAIPLTSGLALTAEEVDSLRPGVNTNASLTGDYEGVPGRVVPCLDADAPAACDGFDLVRPFAVARGVPPTGGYLLFAGRLDQPFATERLGGTDRIETADKIAKALIPFASIFGTKLSDAAILANSRDFPDALAAASLANAFDGPVLLNPRDGLDARVQQRLSTYEPATIFLMGGTAALSADVEAAVKALPWKPRIRRIGGADRYETAAIAARTAVNKWRSDGDRTAGRNVLVALGRNVERPSAAWPDALASGPLAGAAHRPILLTSQSAAPGATLTAIEDLGARAVTVVGGQAAIPQGVAEQLADGRTLQRIGGVDRYETSTLLADEAVLHGATLARTWVATGRDFPDGLAAGGATASNGSVLVLTPSTTTSAAPTLQAWVRRVRLHVQSLTVVGGTSAVSDQAANELTAGLR